MFYRTGVADRSLTLLLWPWPNDFHIRTWPVFPRHIPGVQKWTSYVKVFESCRPTDIHTDIQTDRRRWNYTVYHSSFAVVVTCNVGSGVKLASGQQHWDGMDERVKIVISYCDWRCQQTKKMFSKSQITCFRLSISRKQQIWYRNVRSQARLF